ncbi:MAG: polysaccharide deacetylase family protein [Thermomicrobium sp.]|nr:polysaccharide deacetylase family protein [Thermomicrobium sp.]MDW8005133.1 polysaccharide deacetylase family protein [Thermomicrobium sp.]
MTKQVPVWPAGHRAALVVSIDVDGEYGVIAEHGEDDWYWRGQAKYDLEAGLWRLLELLDDYDIKATFCWVGLAAEERPDALRAVVERGHEIATHGWDHRVYSRMSRSEQQEDLIRTRETIAELAGVTPVGHKSPFWRPTAETVALLQELGFQWNMDLALGDLPVAMRPDPTRHPVIQLPPSRWWDDYPFFIEQSLPPRLVAEFWREDFEIIRAEGKLMCLTLHPWISGRPGPSRALAQFLDTVIALGDVWIARADHVALWWRERERDLEEASGTASES